MEGTGSRNAYEGGIWRQPRELSCALRKAEQGLAACDPAGRPRDDGADAQERGLMSPPKWHDRDVTMRDDEYTYVCVVRV